MKVFIKFILTVLILSVFLFFAAGCSLFTDGYLYIGEGWQDSPEKALEYASNDQPDITVDTYTIAELLDIYYFDGYAEMLYISKAGTLVNASVVTNEEGEWHFHGLSEEESLDDPHYIVVNGDQNQLMFSPYSCDEKSKTVYGWKYSSVSVYINGELAQTKTYQFTLDAKEWSVDYWWVDHVLLDANAEISMSYSIDENSTQNQ